MFDRPGCSAVGCLAVWTPASEAIPARGVGGMGFPDRRLFDPSGVREDPLRRARTSVCDTPPGRRSADLQITSTRVGFGGRFL